MTYPSSSPRRARRLVTRQSGVVLMTTVLALIIVTLLALAMYRGFGVQQKIAGNTREKERAFQSAQNALEFGEGALVKMNQVNAVLGGGCSGANTVVTLDDVRVCSAPLATPADPDSWTAGSAYNPPAMKVQPPGGGTTGGTITDGDNNPDIVYVKPPQLYVQFLGGNSDSSAVLYAVTAGGSGGDAATRAVVKSVYSVSANLSLPDNNPSQSK